MKKLLLFIIFILNLATGYAQKFSEVYDKVTQDDLDLVIDPVFPNADALVLFQTEQRTVKDYTENTSLLYLDIKRSKRTKILTQEGLKYSNIEFQYNGNKGYIKDLKAQIIHVDSLGKVLKTIIDTQKLSIKPHETNHYYKIARLKVPNVKIGSIIEYSYTEVSPAFTTFEWITQGELPIKYSMLEIHFPYQLEYTYVPQGFKKYGKEKKKKARVSSMVNGMNAVSSGSKDSFHKIEMFDVSSFRTKHYITREEDYIKKVSFNISALNNLRSGTTYLTSWPTLVKRQNSMKYFGGFYEDSKQFAQSILKSNTNLNLTNNDQKQIQLIVEYVKKNYTFNNSLSLSSKKDFETFNKTKKGNSTSLNLLALAFLNEVGIEAYPLLVSTRNHGKVNTNLPYSSAFNNTIIYIPEGDLNFIDCTDKKLSFKSIPKYNLNGLGLIAKKNPEWISPSERAYSFDQVVVRIDPKLEAEISKITFSQTKSGYSARSYRSKFDQLDPKKEIERYYLWDYGFFRINELRTSGFQNPEQAVQINFKASYPLNSKNSKYKIKPFAGTAPKENFLNESERILPVDLNYLKAGLYKSIIRIPSGYTIGTPPKSHQTDNPLIKFKIQTQVSPSMIVYSVEYQFKKAIYLPSEYKMLKMHWDQLIKDLNEPIYLEKI
ncbi:MAG: DUF3857 domain-containing protein [Flavobacteriaceae bacterium]